MKGRRERGRFRSLCSTSARTRCMTWRPRLSANLATLTTCVFVFGCYLIIGVLDAHNAPLQHAAALRVYPPPLMSGGQPTNPCKRRFFMGGGVDKTRCSSIGMHKSGCLIADLGGPRGRGMACRSPSPMAMHASSSSGDGGGTRRRWGIDDVGNGALQAVTNLAEAVTRANSEAKSRIRSSSGGSSSLKSVYNVTMSRYVDEDFLDDDDDGGGGEGNETMKIIDRRSTDNRVVMRALTRLDSDMQLLDNLTGERTQLSALEFTLLSLSVLLAASAPMLFPDAPRVAEVVAPATAAFSASIGIGAEYLGKVAVADGKEVAAATLQCAAEAEGLLANAERSKAVMPLCVGISATGASFSLLAPVLIEAMNLAGNLQLVTELYLIPPLVSVLCAAVASLALQETRSYCSRAISIGNRRFAKSGLVGRTWLSSTEQIQRLSQRSSARWTGFGLSIVPAPVVGALVPGVLSTKAIVVAVVAAAQCALFVAQAESSLARGTDAVAIKSRSAAVCDTYANQGARSGAILPYTSALGALCAAGTAAIVELPYEVFVKLILGGAASGVATLAETAIITIFPTLAALCAGAASVSKARCEVDAEAACQAACTLALEYDDGGDDPILRPFQGVIDLLRLTASSGWKSVKRTKLVRVYLKPIWRKILKMFSPS